MNQSATEARGPESDPYISEYMETHQGAASAIVRAWDKLAGEPDVAKAVRKLLPALTSKTLNIFFSYKKKDEAAAVAVVKRLRKYAGDKLRITYQAEFTEDIAGRPWREWIRDEISRANWFILLLPDPSDDWDWCLYETGLFDRRPTSADRLICLHHPDTKIPSPIKDYHAVRATIPDLTKFLEMVYVKSNPIPGLEPINKSIKEDIPSIAAEIAEAIRAPKKCVFHDTFQPFVRLRIDNAARFQDSLDLDTSAVLEANRDALDIFDFRQKPETWGELRTGINESNSDGRWHEELFHVVRKAAQGRKFAPVQAVFHASSGKSYRPVLSAVERLGDKSGPIQSYQITFAEDVSTINLAGMPADLATLATILRMAFRFRWEILEKFTKREITEDEVEKVENAITRME
ncbi:MAG: toll/interleukin-1 receptor domain-containing protein, partial [Gammaproteobacteria bacterium]